MREQKHRLIRTFTAVALMFTAFFAALFGFFTLDRADARAAGEAVRLSVALQPDQYIIDGMTPEQVAAILNVTTVDDNGETVDTLSYDPFGTTGFSLSGEASVSTGLSQICDFVVSHTGFEPVTARFAVQVDRVRAIENVRFTSESDVFSYTNPLTLRQDLSVYTL